MRSAVSSFLAGLLSRHLGTKALSLILSILIFAFVQNTLTGTRELGELTLRFELSPDLRENWVLLRDTVRVPDVRIQGLRRIVDPLAKELKQGQRSVVLTESFLNRYDRTNLVIKPAVLRDILGEDIDVSMAAVDEAIEVNRLVETLNVPVTLAPGLSLVPPEDYRGTFPTGNIDAQITVKRVRLIGPTKAMPKDPVLYVDVNLKKWFAEFDPELTEEREAFSLQFPYVTIDWARSGIRPDMVKHFRIHAPDLTNNPLAAGTFEGRITVRFELMPRLEPREVRLPIVRRDAWKSGVDLSRWESLSSLVTSQALDDGEVRLQVQLPKALLQKFPTLLEEQLVLVLDVADCETEADELKIPFHLDVRDRSRAELLEALQRIEIVETEREVRFRPRDQ